MKRIILALVLITIFLGVSFSGEVKIIAINGNVAVRHDVQEKWVHAAIGDILKPEDSIESGENSSVTLLIDGKAKITIPELVVIDISDLRTVTQEELLLKIAMENIRALPRGNVDELNIPRITTVHGENKSSVSSKYFLGTEFGLKRLSGAKILFENKYYATSILRAKEVFRIYPELVNRIDYHLMVAEAFERLNLLDEAMSECVSLTKLDLSEKDKKVVYKKIEHLKKEIE